jgi:nicotinate-nucleotide pyrophosphorylase (carboxylating)
VARAAEPRLSDRLLGSRSGLHRGVVSAAERGKAAGLGLVPSPARALVSDGDRLSEGDALVEVDGTPADLARIEDLILGELGVACGVATNAARVAAAAPEGLRVVCGGWKKLPAAMKPAVRAGLTAAGMSPRLLEDPFVYVDKNAVRLLGGVALATEAGLALGNGPVAVQIKDPSEAETAVRAGATAVMVDTGELDDLSVAQAALVDAGLRALVLLAFGGGVGVEDMASIRLAGADIVDVGRAVLGSPMLDLRFDVEV